jgi:hypothetical protein
MSEPPYVNRVEEELSAREQESRDPNLRSARAVTGYGLRATDGDLGHVEDFLVDEQDWAIRYLVEPHWSAPRPPRRRPPHGLVMTTILSHGRN